MQNTIKVLLQSDSPAGVDLDQLNTDIATVQKIFPQFKFEDLHNKLKWLATEPNRVHLLIKQLLFEQDTEILDTVLSSSINKRNQLKRKSHSCVKVSPSKFTCSESHLGSSTITSNRLTNNDDKIPEINKWLTYRDKNNLPADTAAKDSRIKKTNLNHQSVTSSVIDAPTSLVLPATVLLKPRDILSASDVDKPSTHIPKASFKTPSIAPSLLCYADTPRNNINPPTLLADTPRNVAPVILSPARVPTNKKHVVISSQSKIPCIVLTDVNCVDVPSTSHRVTSSTSSSNASTITRIDISPRHITIPSASQCDTLTPGNGKNTTTSRSGSNGPTTGSNTPYAAGSIVNPEKRMIVETAEPPMNNAKVPKHQHHVVNNNINIVSDIVDLVDSDSSMLDNEAKSSSQKLYYRILEMFPDVDSAYLKKLCKNRRMTVEDQNDILHIMLSEPLYPKRTTVIEDTRAIDVEEQLEILKQILPDADPDYLMTSLQNIESQNDLEQFIAIAMETHKYPTKADYLRKTQVNQYTTEFDMDKFLEIIPNPKQYFEDSSRKVNNVHHNTKEYYYIFSFLKNLYPQICVKNIRQSLNSTMNIVQACNTLDNLTVGMLNKKRTTVYPIEENNNIPLLQVFAYFKNKNKILERLKNREEKLALDRRNAKDAGLMMECSCCYDNEVMPDDIVSCPTGCDFCKNCLEKSVQIAFGEGKLDFLCMAACGAQFTIQALQRSLKPKLFSKVAQKKQFEEVRAAGIEDLEVCPFCDFATIPAQGNKIFECLNSDCMKQTCRLCKEPSHLPLTCDEVEKDEDVKKRKYIEDKMTEALVRVCWKCNMKYIKSDGCNKMTCSCGAMQCYICNKPVTDYKHFNGQGGDRLDLCPLYSDTNKLHKEAVLKSAATAKKEIGVDTLKVDPTSGVEEYYATMDRTQPALIPNLPNQLPHAHIQLQHNQILQGRHRDRHH